MKENLIKCFDDTLKLCYNSKFRAETEKAIDSSIVFYEGFVSKKFSQKKKATVKVLNMTTLAAAAQYRVFGRVAILNFANPEVPGGGVKCGAKAQEESLCRCSNLYPCIASPSVYEDFYNYHYKCGRFFYSDRIIYTKDISVFKDDELNLLDKKQMFKVDVITCAAPLTAKRSYTNKTVLYELYRSRIKNIFNVAIENNVDVLVLGAFGCGAFKNPPDIVAKAFKSIITENQYDEFFNEIVFAIKSSNNDDPFEPCPNLMAFEYEFFGISIEANKLRFADPHAFQQAFGTVTLPSGRILYGGKEFNKYFEWKNSNKFNGKQFSILGDSISTLEGYNPQGYNLFFNRDNCQKTNVLEMSDTWWGQVIKYCGGELLINNSWSGCQVAKLPDRETLFPSGCSDERTNGLHMGYVKPDIILVFLGTNDWARGVKLTYDDCTNQSNSTLYAVFRTAYEKMLENLEKNYPNAKIFCCTLCSTYMSVNPSFTFPKSIGGTDIEKYNAVIRDCADKKKCKIIDLYKYHLPYDSIDGIHPNRNGMNTLATLMLREMLDKVGSAFLDCNSEEHFFIAGEKLPVVTSNVCKKCGKLINVNDLPKSDDIILKKENEEYIRKTGDKTTELFPCVLRLTDTSNKSDIEISAGTVSVGRLRNCGIFFNAEKNPDYKFIGRRHADFLYERQTWYLRDNDSKNGTWLNGIRIKPKMKYDLAANDEIVFATSGVFVFYKR